MANFLRLLSKSCILLLIGGALSSVYAQDGPVHGTIESTSGGTAVIQLKEGYRVEPGTRGTIFEERETFGQTTTVKVEIRATEADGRSVTVELLEESKVDSGQNVRFASVEEVGTLVVRPNPDTARVYLDGEVLGQGIVQQTVGTGPYKVQVVADGYETRAVKGIVETGETEDRTVRLEEQVGRLAVTSTPSAQLEIGEGRYETIGRTPIESEELSPGTYDLRLSRDGYQAITDEVSIEAGTLTEKSYTLEEAVGTIRVTSDPSGADVYVDGEYQGTTQLRLEVEPGNYEIEVDEYDYESETEDVWVRVGETERVDVDLGQETTTASTDSDSSDDTAYSEGPTLSGAFWATVLGAGLGALTAENPDEVGTAAGVGGGLFLVLYLLGS